MTPKLTVASETWEATLDVFSSFADDRLEGGCFWYGVRGRSTPLTVIGIPRQTNQPLNFSIPADAMVDLNGAVPDEQQVIVQLHGHPGMDVSMSTWDEALVVSRRVISLVLPDWGRRPVPVHAVGVHAFVGDAWTMMPFDDVVSIVGPTGMMPVIVDRR